MITCQYSKHIGMNYYQCSAPIELKQTCMYHIKESCVEQMVESDLKRSLYHYELDNGYKLQTGEAEIRTVQDRKFILIDGNLVKEIGKDE